MVKETEAVPKIAICQWCLKDQSPSGIRKVKEMGYDGIAMDFGLGCRERDLRIPGLAERYVYEIRKEGLQIPSIALNYLEADTEEKVIEAEKICQMAMDMAVYFGAHVLMIPNFGATGMETKIDFNRMTGMLKRLCREAAEYSLIISSENPLDLMGNLKLVDAVSMSNFKIYFDTANPLMMKNMDSLQMMNELWDHICEIHIKDFKSLSEWNHAPLGKGICGTDESMNLILKKEFQGWLVNENQLPDVLQIQDACYLKRKLWNI